MATDSVIVYQTTFEGQVPAGLTRRAEQLWQIMKEHPETVDDEDLLAAYWLQERRWWEYPLEDLKGIAKDLRVTDIRRGRQELRHIVPYSPEEEKRRQARAKAGPPGER